MALVNSVYVNVEGYNHKECTQVHDKGRVAVKVVKDARRQHP
jgi:hypothetical protein